MAGSAMWAVEPADGCLRHSPSSHHTHLLPAGFTSKEKMASLLEALPLRRDVLYAPKADSDRK